MLRAILHEIPVPLPVAVAVACAAIVAATTVVFFRQEKEKVAFTSSSDVHRMTKRRSPDLSQLPTTKAQSDGICGKQLSRQKVTTSFDFLLRQVSSWPV